MKVVQDQGARSVTTIDSKTLTVSDYLADYLKYCQEDKQLSIATVRGYKHIVEKRISPSLGDEKLRELTPYTIEDFYRELKASGGTNGGPLSGATCQRVHSLLKTALRRAVYLRHIEVNPCDVLKGPRIDRKEANVLCEKEVVRMLELLKGHPQKNFAVATTLAVSTGMRRGEICGLTWKNVDLNAEILTVAQSLLEVGRKDTTKENTLIVKEPKTARSKRKVYLDEDLLSLLKAEKSEQRFRLAYLGIEQTDNTPVCAHPQGGWYRPDSFTSDFIQFRNEQGFDVRLHDLRHTHATLLLKDGRKACCCL
ncbi:MAG: site-specific integrase [Coriobacteriia bacterium]|nr:site-specific integrase [Coriobacteriia bacterium]